MLQLFFPLGKDVKGSPVSTLANEEALSQVLLETYRVLWNKESQNLALKAMNAKEFIIKLLKGQEVF